MERTRPGIGIGSTWLRTGEFRGETINPRPFILIRRLERASRGRGSPLRRPPLREAAPAAPSTRHNAPENR